MVFDLKGSTTKAVNSVKNVGCPDEYKDRTRIDINDIRTPITIDSVFVITKLVKDKNGNIVTRKADKSEIYKPIVYIGFDGDKFTSSKSPFIVNQMIQAYGDVFSDREYKIYSVPAIEGLKVVIGSEKNKYTDGKEYDNPILKPAD